MASSPVPAYRGLISARSRRLRVIGTLLLIAALSMAIYGGVSLMPSLHGASEELRTLQTQTSPSAAEKKLLEQRKEKLRKVVKVQFIFAYGYWSICGLSVLAMLVVAWLDVRETSRNYLAERQSIWKEKAEGERPEAKV